MLLSEQLRVRIKTSQQEDIRPFGFVDQKQVGLEVAFSAALLPVVI